MLISVVMRAAGELWQAPAQRRGAARGCCLLLLILLIYDIIETSSARQRVPREREHTRYMPLLCRAGADDAITYADDAARYAVMLYAPYAAGAIVLRYVAIMMP